MDSPRKVDPRQPWHDLKYAQKPQEVKGYLIF
jgi:hypothetical protein